MNAFIAIVLASLLSRLGYQMARSPVLPIFAADLGALPELIGVIVAASTITGVFFKLPSGALSDVLGRKRMMVLGALFFAAPPFLYPFVYDAWSLLALRFVHGFATAIFSPVASAYVASLADTGRGARLGWFSSANDIGATAGPLFGGFVLYFTVSYSRSSSTPAASQWPSNRRRRRCSPMPALGPIMRSGGRHCGACSFRASRASTARARHRSAASRDKANCLPTFCR